MCDAEWNCPRGNDEINCINRTCPGQLKCKNSEMCIAIDNLCDIFADCPYFDDTNFCEAMFAGYLQLNLYSNYKQCDIESLVQHIDHDEHDEGNRRGEIA